MGHTVSNSRSHGLGELGMESFMQRRFSLRAFAALVTLTAAITAGPGAAHAETYSGPYGTTYDIGQAYGPLAGGTTYSAVSGAARDQNWFMVYFGSQVQVTISFSQAQYDCGTLRLWGPDGGDRAAGNHEIAAAGY